MKKLSNFHFSLAAIFILVLGFMFVGPEYAQAADKNPFEKVLEKKTNAVPVNVENTPLPIQGEVAIKNTPNVNITNTPNVNIANVPTVQVGNTPGNPVLVQNVSELKHEVFQENLFCNIENDYYCTISFEVPKGKHLVIEYISAYAYLPIGQQIYMNIVNIWNNKAIYYPFPMFPFGAISTTTEFHMLNHQVKIYVDKVLNIGFMNISHGGGSGVITFSGYLVDNF